MASKYLYIQIIFRSSLILVTSLFSGWLVFQKENLVIGAVIIIIAFLQVLELIHFLNKTNRKIAFFFDAIRNDDSTLYFPEKSHNKSLRDLNASLNKVNQLIKNIKVEQQEQEQYFKVIIEHVSIGIITYNKDGNILLANTAAKKLLNYEYLNHIEQLSRVDQKLYSAFKEIGAGERKLVSVYSGQTEARLSLKANSFKNSHSDLMLVTIQDIKNELEEQELDAWIKLIRVLTHEIMNTIAPITSLSETLLGYYKNLHDAKPSQKVIDNTIKGLNVINERGTGLISFVDSYRKLTRLPQPKKENIEVKDLCDKLVTLVSIETLGMPVKIEVDIVPDNMKIFADEKQISQVLINLIKNSKESLVSKKNAQIVISGCINEQGRPQIEVKDNGSGISEDILPKIFIPFFSTKESGSGIGLSLSRQIMQLHGGTLKVVSVPNKFTSSILLF